MNGEQAERESDFFLREIPNVKITQKRKPDPPKNTAKEEIKLLHLSANSQQLVMETLKFIHGPDYSLDDASKYKDDQIKYKHKFLQQNNLVVKGGFYHSDVNPDSEEDKYKMFALLRLESYGFHRTHCAEALEYCKGELEEALYIIYKVYFRIGQFAVENLPFTDSELLEQRKDEKGVLESIYEKSFEEKIPNSVWLIKLKLDYLVHLFYPNKKSNRLTNSTATSNFKTKKKVERCRGFLRGHCKFGEKCRFSHRTEEQVNNNVDGFLDNYTFELEFRFAATTKYPFEPPIIFLKTDLVLPELMPLHICKRLHQEATVFAQDGIPSIYAVVELLKNEDIITEYITNVKVNFILPVEKLFPDENDNGGNRTLGSKYLKKGRTNKDARKELSTEQLLKEDKNIVYRFAQKGKDAKYKRMQEVRRNLPAWALRKEIIDTIASAQVCVISGETGCGKSTQVPQFLLDDWLENYGQLNGKHIEIVCTQPRRISTIGVAERVAEERNERIGDTVGYQIRLESKVSASTRLTFCTTGILLRRLEYDPTLETVSHIIVDEVHERSEDSDFLLLIVKDLLKIRTDLKVILMSATLNAIIFSDYFAGTPALEIPGRTFPVDQYFLEDILEESNYVLEENSQYTRKLNGVGDLNKEFETQRDIVKVNTEKFAPKTAIKDDKLSIAQLIARYSGFSMKTCKNLYTMDPEKIDLDLIEAILLWIVFGDHNYPREGAILIFLPGISEITSLHDQLNNSSEFSSRYGKYELLPLHSSLTSEEQSAIFRKPKNGARKIVISTNLAETSVTIDDCVFVIDSGKMKEKRFDSCRNMESLDTVWETRANALQRKGRAGRVMSGVCIHLFTSFRFKYHFLGQPIPEIHRVPLEQLLLHIKVLPNFAERSLHHVLESTIEPPLTVNIDLAIKRLVDVGAFDDDNALTPLGHHLAALPVDVRIGKLMLYGAIFGCVDSALTMAASLSFKNPFVSPFGKKDQAGAKKREFAIGNSDHLTILRAYNKWRDVNTKNRRAGYNFANENYLSAKTLETIADIKYQLLELLVSIGFVSIDLKGFRHRTGQDNITSLTGAELNQNGSNIRLLTSILCASLYPNIVKILTPQTVFMKSAAGAIPLEREAKELRFKTMTEEVFLHPSSVNYPVKNFQSPYLVFQEKVKTSRIFIRDSSMVPIVPLVIFCSSGMDICVNDGTTFLVLADGFIRFHVENHRVAEMIKAIRVEFLDLLEEKIKDPLLNLQHDIKGEKIINTIVHITTND